MKEPKYKPGDHVWMMKNNKAVEFIIAYRFRSEALHFSEEVPDEERLYYRLDTVDYKEGYDAVDRQEAELFPTKGSLLESL